MPNMSPSSYDHFRTCPRLYYWQHIVKLDRVKEEGARRFGTMYHAGLDAWWRAMDGGDVPWRDKDGALVMALRGIRADAEKHAGTDPYETARAEAMMIGYHARYFELEFEPAGGDDGVEEWFNVPLIDGDGTEVPGWRLVGRKDAIKRFADGRTKPVEHKTTGQKIHAAADYWKGIAINTQVSVYIDVARRLGLSRENRIVYDVSRKPNVDPLLATPVEKRKMTKGKGCKECGGRAGGKEGPARGTGEVMARVEHPVTKRKMDEKISCPTCNGTGWSEQPALYANQRTADEDHVEYGVRVGTEIASDPDAYYRMADVMRTDDQLNEARTDLVVTSAEIDALTSLARRHDDMTSVGARRSFPRCTTSCTNMYGRNCDYLPVCSGETEPFTSGLYQIRKKGPR